MNRNIRRSVIFLIDLSDGGDLAGGNSSVPGSESSPRSGALNYSSALNATSNSNAALVSQNSSTMSSTEALLINIQELLKVAVDNARQKDRQINYEKGKSKFFVRNLGGVFDISVFQMI